MRSIPYLRQPVHVDFTLTYKSISSQPKGHSTDSLLLVRDNLQRCDSYKKGKQKIYSITFNVKLSFSKINLASYMLI